MKTNTMTRASQLQTFEGATAKRITTEQELRRSVMANLLFEGTFYEDGVLIADRIKDLVGKLNGVTVSKIAIEARSSMNLRHVPLLLARELARHSNKEARTEVADTLTAIIQRPDELAEYLAIYWKDKRQPLSAQSKRGLARAFTKFDEYRLAKYNRDGAVKLRDVLFLVHAKPGSKEQEELWKRLVEGKLATPDTWEVSLSAGEDKKTTFTRLIEEGKLGPLALLRNLRNMDESGVPAGLIRAALDNMKTERILPFRFIAAAKYAPQFEPNLEKAMFRNMAEMPKLTGKTVLLVDNSGSMHGPLSAKSQLDRREAAAGLAMLLRETCHDVSIISFGTTPVLVAPRRGFALRDVIRNANTGGSTMTELAKQAADKAGYDRVIVITDEQSHESLSNPKGRGYVCNVAPYKNGIGYGQWIHVDGWSEAIVSYIQEYERAGF